jgi:TonB-linked SusC/RagA family outer membrane protein
MYLNNLLNKKHWRINILLLLFFYGTSLAAAHPDNGDDSILKKRISIIAVNKPLRSVLDEIQEKTRVNFVFQSDIIVQRKVTIQADNVTLNDVLSRILSSNSLTYEPIDNTIVIKRMTKPVAKEVSGVVRAGDTNEPLPGVNVWIKNTSEGTITDVSGRFTINVEEGAVLVFSFVGYISQEIPVNNQTFIEVALPTDAKSLSEVVVTALGIKREEKSLGYATTKLEENTLKDARSNNWVSSLSGKVAGLNLVGTGSGPIGSTRITLRGESSLNLDNNQALIVVDGIPVSNRITGTGHKAHLGADSPVDFGSTVSDLNPDDIENVTVLKGPAATALYGSRAANGALIITTKSGSRKENGLGITVNSNIAFDQVNRWPDYQYEYGEGRTDAYYSYGVSEDGANTSTNVAAGRAWGPRFNGQMYYQYNPLAADGMPTERTPWRAYDDYITGFFKTGVTLSNSISLDGKTDKSSARFSLTHFKNKWIMPNTGFERLSLALSLSHNINAKLKVNAKVNYTNKTSDNLPLSGYNNHTIMYWLIIGTAPNININWFKDYWKTVDVQQKNPFNPGPDNPYLQMYEMLNTIDRHGIVGNTSVSYEVNDHIEITGRAGIDFANETRDQQRPFSMTKYPRGMYRQQDVFQYETNVDILATYKNQIGAILNYSVSAGANAMKQHYNFSGMYADQLAMPGVYMISNSLDQAVADPNKQEKAINSVYVSGQFDYQDKVFLQVTGRNDWSSTLPYKNNSFFYPSVNTSFVFDEILTLPRQISFLKTRLSWAQVGNDTRPYQTARYYDKIYSNNFTNPTTLFNDDLKPEITSSYEAGLDIRLFENRVGLDVSVYRNDSRNQILEIPLDPTTGYSRALMNAGLISSRGVEVMATVKPVSGEKLKWNTTFTWSRNRSYVKELTAGLDNQVLASHESNVTIEARVGGRMGDMYGRGFQRSPEGEVIYTADGLPAELDPNVKKLGNAFADWKGGVLNELTYKNFRFTILFDGQYGGDVYSQTNHKLNTLGKTTVTLPGRDGGIVGYGVVRQGDGTFAKNTKSVSAQKYYEEYYKISNAETNIFDASFVKLREVRLEYSVPRPFARRLGMQQASIAVYGRELFNFTKFPAFDPEVAMLNSGTIVPGVEMTQFPSTRTMGMNLTMKF